MLDFALNLCIVPINVVLKFEKDFAHMKQKLFIGQDNLEESLSRSRSNNVGIELNLYIVPINIALEFENDRLIRTIVIDWSRFCLQADRQKDKQADFSI